ncbi:MULTISPECIES: hypothetical protein [unclassified Methylobacterium]|uniref:hypothetical protein n=1 Tax=unclassified Methylobacterium TaxID=2615210 RepID=UPI0006F49ECE|nr:MULTISPECIES: hypothetical protein [unclassified Methylobacterium]KQO60961.1 hypothetical protein ASF24_03160 [Methylobacterium sp. Leaf86]KQO87949.1 hypothetical protein ASF32_06150 [Methylobacterium sp. Leaf91]MBO1021750.1 hypothetical protein [Methylobacterium sp. SD274]
MSDSIAGLAQSIVSNQTAATRESMQTTFIRKQGESDRAISQMLQQSADQQKAVLPEGQGAVVDRQV